MVDQEKHIIITRIMQGTATQAEREQFRVWVNASEDQLLTETVDLYFLASLTAPLRAKLDHALTTDIIAQMKSREVAEQTTPMPLHRVHFLRTAWFRVAVAVLLFVGTGAYLWLQPSTDEPAITQTKPVPVKNDVLPGGNRAILKLADGSEIMLDSAANGLLAKQAGAVIEKNAAGQITYQLNKASLSDAVTYNTMSTPRGGEYQLTLPDGSKVWLNAESSIKFPTAFTGNKREVSITGEVYFEVKANKAKPFIVKTYADEIMVLGTSFNINAYKEELKIKTSLVEGVVKIGQKTLKPGQAYVKGNIIQTDLNKDLAWKTGFITLGGSTVEEIMRQVARWYDVEVVFEKGIPDVRLGGKMDRKLTLSQALAVLNRTKVHARLEGKKLIVYP